ncbi:DUF2589 domain-containing protein [Treponema sp.]|uniref:DUF2589 domain-containing protein n=1 Tax=Treponema sp. TaxID=166 RepID=UPI003F0337A2
MAIWNKDGQRNGEKQSSVDLSDVIKGMQNAVNEAEKMLEMHNLRSIRNFFHEDGDPKTIELHLTEDNYLEVPVLALANHNSLKIDKLTMEFEAKIEQVGISNADDILKAVQKDGTVETETTDRKGQSGKERQERNAVFSVGFAGKPDSNLLKVKLEFSSAGQTEGLSRIIDEYNKLIVPYTAIEGEDASPWKNH